MTAALAGAFDFGGASFTDDGVGFRFSSTRGEQFYVGHLDLETVPVPAGLVLLASGLGGLAALRRRRRS